VSLDISGTSFKALKEQEAPRRLIIGLDALERKGKTHFALTAPGPIAYLQMDPGGDDVLPKAKKLFPKKEFVHTKYYVDIKPSDAADRVKVTGIANAIWSKTVQDFELILPALGRGTLVVDTASEWFTCLKLARFGKLTQVMPEDYAPVHSEYKRLLRMVYQSQANVIFLHKLKAEYDRPAGEANKKGSGKKTGNLIRDGYSGTGYEMQINARADKEEDGTFIIRVTDCRQNPDLDGQEIPVGEMTGFADLATYVYPDTKVKDWTY
jgi:hypothetical protein